MAWNFREAELEEQLRTVKQQLFTKDRDFALLNGKLLKQTEELSNAKSSLEETLYKLQREADNVVNLESTLSRRDEELQNERVLRENAEAAQRNLVNELKEGDSSTKDLNSIISRLSHELDSANSRLRKVTGEKSKLDIRVGEMEVLIQRQQMMPPPPQKTPGRPRSSSLTHLNIVSMERELETLRSTSKSYQAELESSRTRISKMQDDLVRVENEKLVLKKHLIDKDLLLRSALEEVEERKREMSYLDGMNGSAEREEQLLARLEEEEKKVELLTQELASASRSNTGELRRSVDRLQNQLRNESSRVRMLEEREIVLTQEREEALNDRDEALAQVEELTQTLKERDESVTALQVVSHGSRAELDSRGSPSPEFSTVSISTMLSAIDRLRTERDDLQTSLEYLQVESRFSVQALQDKISALEQATHDKPATDRMDEDVQVISQEQFEQIQKELLESRAQASKTQTECHSLRSQLQSDAEMYAQTLTDTMKEKAELLDAKNTEIKALHDRVSEMTTTLKNTTEERDVLSQQSHRLQCEIAELQQDIQGYQQRVSSMQTAQMSSSSQNGAVHALKEQIAGLEARVLRRNEQIGVHQHDIKRLETNLRLAEERLGEMSSELEMANTEKTAMVEDCATAREERDEMRKARDSLEIELDEVTRQVSERDGEIQALHSAILSAQEALVQDNVARVDEIASLVAVIVDRHTRLRLLSAKMKDAEQQASFLVMDDSKSTLTDSPVCEQVTSEDVNMKIAEVDDAMIQQLEADRARLSISLIPSMTNNALVELLKTKELEATEVSRLAQLREVQLSLDERQGKTQVPHEQLEIERRSYLDVVRTFVEEYNHLVDELEKRVQDYSSQVVAANKERSHLESKIDTARQEVADLRESLKNSNSEHEKVLMEIEASKADMQQRLDVAHGELEAIKASLEAEVNGRREDNEKFEAERKMSTEKNDELGQVEAALQRELEQCRSEVVELQATIEKLQAENLQVRREVEELGGETHRAKCKSECMEKQLRLSEEEVSNLKQALQGAREDLARSEKSGKAAEMNLQLAITQHDRTIANLRRQLVDFDDLRTRNQSLEQSVAEMREELDEKEELLKRKCDEIEANDDKAIAMLKESKKLQRTIELLNKKNVTLQKKLDKALETTATPQPTAGPSKSTTEPMPKPSPVNSRATKIMSTTPPIEPAPTPRKIITPPKPKPSPNLVAEVVLTSVFSPAQQRQEAKHRQETVQLQTPPQPTAGMSSSTSSTSAGKKRRAPDDFFPNEPLPAQPIVVEAVTPRPRKPLRTLKTGFTPVRGLGANARPTLGQPSPLRRSGSQAAERSITDVTNATRRGGASSNGGWLEKLRGNGPSKRQAQHDDFS